MSRGGTILVLFAAISVTLWDNVFEYNWNPYGILQDSRKELFLVLLL